jgi:hypothetical protein
MSGGKMKCILILSSKFSGSTACQDFLSTCPGVHRIAKTRHFQQETLYWTKAASLLRLPQQQMLDSEVPIPANKAKTELIEFLRENLASDIFPLDEAELIFSGWRRLCEYYGPVFIEKSPHHLFQWSALELIIECMEKLREIDFLLIGLVRNPMDVLYSAYRNEKTYPEKYQYEWLMSYKNLINLKDLVKEKLFMLRYEDMVANIDILKPVFQFTEVKEDSLDRDYFHTASITKWKHDQTYGFLLSDEVIDLAESYGYKKEELTNEPHPLWPFYRNISRLVYKSSMPARQLLRRSKGRSPRSS